MLLGLSCNVRFCNPAEGGKDVESRYCRSLHAFSGWQRRRPSELSQRGRGLLPSRSMWNTGQNLGLL